MAPVTTLVLHGNYEERPEFSESFIHVLRQSDSSSSKDASLFVAIAMESLF